ncbi:MAG: hypothetical protein R3C55_10930 [Parvularculaceae bacterium]
MNDAVAMTGGQPIDGELTVPEIASQLKAEGVKKIVIVSDDPEAIEAEGGYPSDVAVYHRDELDAVQRELREIKASPRTPLCTDLRSGKASPPQARAIS